MEWNTMDKRIDYIIAVAECKSISKAAELLYISQPSLSRYCSMLESELGLRLFERSASGVSLTEAGETYVTYAKEIKRLQSTMDRKLYQMKMKATDQISVCMTLNANTLSNAEITEEFCKRYPGCRLEFTNVFARDIPAMLAEEKYDFAIGPDVGERALFSYKTILHHYFILAVPKRYDFEDFSEEREGFVFPWIDLSRLSNIDFVFQNSSCNVRKSIDKLLALNNMQVKPKMEFANSILAIQAAERQFGCCFLSDSFLTYVTHQDSLKYYCVGDESISNTTGIIYEKDKIFNQQEKYCIKIIKKALIDGKDKILEKFMV